MKKVIFPVLYSLTLSLGLLSYSANACDCDKGSEQKCDASKTAEDCHCGKKCKHHKHKKSTKDAVPAATTAPEAKH